MSLSAAENAPKVGRVIPNAPVGHHTRLDLLTPATSLRRVKDNAPYIGQ
jgi:hypothetical protein